MSRSDLLLQLVEAGSQNDQSMLERTVEAMVAEARAKQHHTFADRLNRALRDNRRSRAPRAVGGTMLPEKVRDLIVERPAMRTLDTLALDEACLGAVQELIEEQQQGDVLRAHSLEPRNRVMLVGPPGNGKTSLAEAISYELSLPFYICRYEGIIGSYLGETASRLKRVFDFARSTPCVLFLDEFDAIGKERGDLHETGEIKRVVSSLLMQVDDLPTYTVLVAATNHPELVDSAVWRRFQIRLPLKAPTAETVSRLMAPLAKEHGIDVRKLAKAFQGASYADLEEFVLDVRRNAILRKGRQSPTRMIEERLTAWKNRYNPMQGEMFPFDAPRHAVRGSHPARNIKKTSREARQKAAPDPKLDTTEPETRDPFGPQLF